MNTNKKTFACDKATVLNVIYDALEALSFMIVKSNSCRGTLIVSSSELPKLGGRIAVSPDITESKTLVEVIANSDDEQQKEWIAALLDEMQSLIERTGMEVSK